MHNFYEKEKENQFNRTFENKEFYYFYFLQIEAFIINAIL